MASKSNKRKGLFFCIYFKPQNELVKYGATTLMHILRVDPRKENIMKEFCEKLKGIDNFHFKLEHLNFADMERNPIYTFIFEVFTDNPIESSEYDKIKTIMESGNKFPSFKLLSNIGSKMGSSRFDLD